MHRTYRAGSKLRFARSILTTLAALAALGLAYRIYRASAMGIVETLSSIATAVFVIGALVAGWAVHVSKLRARAEQAEWEAARLRREELLDDDADRELWDSIPAHPLDEDTCAFGVNVIAINQYQRYPEAG